MTPKSIMRKNRETRKNLVIFKSMIIMTVLSTIIVLAGCGGRYGSYNRDAAIYQAFQTNQVNRSYRYYYNGVGNQVYAIVGIEPRYQIHSEFWREVEPDTEKFKTLTNRIWEDYGYRTYGADLLSPSGKKIGVVYTSIYDVVVKFLGNNQLKVMLGTPYLWGPGGDDNGTWAP